MNLSTSERLQELLGLLTRNQLRYIVAMQESNTKGEAAKKLGLKANTIYSWPSHVDEAADLLALHAVETACRIREQNLVKAMMVKVAGLDSADERVRQNAATEIIEGELGKAGQRLEVLAFAAPAIVKLPEVIDDE